jgi:hypothetical protein
VRDGLDIKDTSGGGRGGFDSACFGIGSMSRAPLISKMLALALFVLVGLFGLGEDGDVSATLFAEECTSKVLESSDRSGAGRGRVFRAVSAL